MSAAAPPRLRPTLADAGNRARLAAIGGMVALAGYVTAVDPETGGVYPLCPSRLVLGIDCPACGGLRGTSDLLNGRIVEALDHNLLLPGLLGIMGVMFGRWLLPLTGRVPRPRRPPPWALVAVGTVLVVFTVLRNLPVTGLELLASDPRG